MTWVRRLGRRLVMSRSSLYLGLPVVADSLSFWRYHLYIRLLKIVGQPFIYDTDRNQLEARLRALEAKYCQPYYPDPPCPFREPWEA
jgi:hypothetical protein